MSEGKAINPSENVANKKKMPTWVWVVGGVLVVGLIAQAFGNGSEEPEAVAPEEPSVVLEEENGGEETDVATATQSFEDIDALAAAVADAIGSQTAEGADRGLSVKFQELAQSEEDAGWLLIHYTRDESMSKSDVWTETERIFLLARQAEFVNSLTLILKTEIIDNRGERVEVSAFVADFDRETYSRINPEIVVGELYERAVTNGAFDSRVRWG